MVHGFAFAEGFVTYRGENIMLQNQRIVLCSDAHNFMPIMLHE